MKNIEILKKVADLVGFKFNSLYSFEEVELEGGLVISNQTEGAFQVGDVVSLKNEDGTYTIVGSGEHKLLDGRVFITDAEGKLAEIKSEVEEKVEVVIEAAEVPVEIKDEVVDVMTPDVVSALVDALTPVVEELKMLSEEMKKLKKDYEGFKASSAYQPLKEDKLVSSNFTDHRYELLREMKENLKK
jgi:hypothetical protein